MERMHARRLLKLADKLDTVPRKKFDINTWFTGEKPGDIHECGTTACGMGHACLIRSFQAAGLKLGRGGTPEFRPTREGEMRACRKRAEDECCVWWFEICGNAFRGSRAATYFFGLSRQEAEHLFYPISYYDSQAGARPRATPKALARRIRKLVKKYHPELVLKKALAA